MELQGRLQGGKGEPETVRKPRKSARREPERSPEAFGGRWNETRNETSGEKDDRERKNGNMQKTSQNIMKIQVFS